MKTYFNMLLFLILGLVQMDRAHSQDPQWPLHTICNSNKLTVTYRSCDPLQDVGVSFLPCPNKLTDPTTVRIAFILRQSITEFYSSIKLFLNGLHVWGVDEPLCLPQFPRFTFCGSRRGEMITFEMLIKSKVDLPLKGDFNLMVHGINQDGFQIACVNATLSFW
ncbi:lymphocyte antigen 86 isoform X1 [Danio rerio]|uniref:Lymphocyte antigen 86 n=1 Tax=Danio rerio TaxID=7955 RepID=E7F6I2_DANRE|nr:lymphocyte antigen 86 isoform X1 [Danio rerio]|eukprot:XP_009295493.1 lymphocyte antigen 86 isoform X1 [Danio rerio]